MVKCVVLALALSTLGAQAPQTVFRSVSDGVAVNVTVMNGRKPATGLVVTDFQVRDAGVPQQVVSLSLETRPLELLLLVDDSASIQRRPIGIPYAFRDETNIQRWFADVREELNRSLRPSDRVRTFRFSTTLIEEQPGVRSSPPDTDALAARRGRTALLDVIAEALMLPSSVDRRRVLVVVSDGRDTASALDDRTQLAIADRSDAAIFLLAVGGRTGSIASLGAWIDGYEGLLQALTTRSGGSLLTVDPGERVADVLQRLLDELRTQYLLTYIPANMSMGWHDIEVSVSQKKYDVRAKRGYWR